MNPFEKQPELEDTDWVVIEDNPVGARIFLTCPLCYNVDYSGQYNEKTRQVRWTCSNCKESILENVL